ncbi:MAG TPA: ABC transporter permease [Bacteroidales bacterium]|nr:ABC transporter permease [Bacteroidales bacterium]
MRVLFKTVFRNFVRHPVTNLINLFGLSISLSIVIILSIYSYSELTTDNFHENVNEVFILRKNASANSIYTPGVLAETVKGKIPGIRSIVRITAPWEAVVFQSEEKEPIISDMLFADKEFFELFSYRSSEGNLNIALEEPMNLAISESLAEKLFGEDQVVGRKLKYNNDKIFTISAVFKEQEKNTCFRFNSITSVESQKILQPYPEQYTRWGWNNFQTFFFLERNQNLNNIIASMQQLIPEENDERKQYKEAGLIPLNKIYFSKLWTFRDYMVFGSFKKTFTLLMVAILVLMIALVNFVNISSSQWRERTRQFGILKVLGANRFLIVREITAESYLVFLAALLIAIQLSSTFSPVIHNTTDIIFNERIIGSFGFIILTISGIIVLSVIISIIPAIRISSSNAIDNLKRTILKGKITYASNGTLVTIQFIVAIALISFTILVQKQVIHGTSSLGINQDNIINIKLTPQLIEKKNVLRTALEKIPAIDKISFSQYYPGTLISNWGVEIDLQGEKKMVFFDTFCADESFFSLMGLNIISGRLYSDSLSTDKDKMVVNESFIKKYNIADPSSLSLATFDGRKAEVLGVIKDFHHKPVNTEIAPLVIRNDGDCSFCAVHFTSKDFRAMEKTLADIKKIATEISPSFPVEVSFMDDAIQGMYQSELTFRRAFMLLAACALLICCLGILAMSISVCQKRVKEIGIRRVNGAKASEILFLLNRDLVKWVVVAFIISVPVSWYFMNLWLKSYAYKTDVSWWIFAVAGISALTIALLTVSWQSWRASTRNPVEALRYE